MSDAVIYIIIAACAVLAGAIQSMAGFGAAIVLLLVLPRFFDVVTAAALNQAICMGTVIIMAVQFRKYTEWKKLLLPGLAFMLSSVVTIRLVKNANLHWLGAAFGVFLIVLALYYLFWQKNIKIDPTPLLAFCFGLISGVLSGLFSIGATLMAMYFLAVSEDRNHYMANLQTLMAFNNVVGISMRAATGIYTASLLLPTALGFAGILIGKGVGTHLAGKMDTQKLNRFIYVLVAVTGVETLIKQLGYIL